MLLLGMSVGLWLRSLVGGVGGGVGEGWCARCHFFLQGRVLGEIMGFFGDGGDGNEERCESRLNE